MRACVLLLLSALAAGCAAPAHLPPSTPPAPGTPAGEPQWWSVGVRMGYQGPEQVRWHLDALLAEQVFAPLIHRHGSALVLWRFHRRAAPDEAGHQLRFLFYADPAIARAVTASLQGSALLEALQRQTLVSRVLLPGSGESPGAQVEDASDPGWPRPLQRAWPHFAMGVSRNWLALIAEVGGARDAPGAGDVDALVEHYRLVNAQVDALWQAHAQHAWLHHLNALFGYQPALVQERRLMRF